MTEPSAGPGEDEAPSALTPSLLTMHPDHPMLQRAQQALSRQLNAKRMRVEGELREKQNALSVSLCARRLHCHD